MGLFPIDIGFGENGKGNAEPTLAKRGDLGVRAGFLMAKLVAREGQHCEAAWGQRRLQLLQARILRRKPAFGGNVHD